MPGGINWDGRRYLHGRAAVAGEYPIRVHAANEAGTTAVDLTISVHDAELVHRFRTPTQWVRGRPLVIEFQLLDARGKLHFLDFSDHAEGRVLGRLEPDAHQRTHWSGRFVTTLEQLGRHDLTVRIVRHDPAREAPLFFEDHGFQVEVIEEDREPQDSATPTR